MIMNTALPVMSTTLEHVARQAEHAATSARMGPSGHPARSADQGEAAALLDSGQPLLVHAGGVNLPPQRRHR